LELIQQSNVQKRGADKRIAALHVLLLSGSNNRMTGADRDWVNLTKAFSPGQIRITWSGREGSGYLRPYLDQEVVTRVLDFGFPDFNYVLHGNAYLERSSWLWLKIVADHLLRLRRPLLELRRAMAHDPPDIVVSNAAPVTIGAVYAKLCRRPHVWCVKECLDIRQQACRRMASLITRCSSAVVAPSRAVAESFAAPVHVFPDGCDLDLIINNGDSPDREAILTNLGLPTSRLVVAQNGGIVHWKGPHITAEAFVRLKEVSDEPPCSLLFLGAGDDDFKMGLLSIVKRAGPKWTESVRFVRFDPNDYSYLRCADIVVHPSVLPDPFPNAVREAMILGKPVIGSDLGGIPEMIEDGRTGYLVTPQPGPLANRIMELLSSPKERDRLGQAARDYALQHFDIRRCKDAFLALFRKLAAR
jgi:glycosyltransferase involved in cell wall biosynthesis